jgi:hypothetical protein
MKKLAKKVLKFFYTRDPKISEIPNSITYEQYLSELSYDPRLPEEINSKNKEKAKRAFEMVVQTRQFEIELYWKRAAYFWAFIVSVFAAYVALQKDGSTDAILAIIVLGFVISMAWLFSNIGSKQWQRHWEKHLDLLEDRFVGPLYKTVFFRKTFSVSKLNDIVSGTVVVAWIVLAADHLANLKISIFNMDGDIALSEIIILSLGAIAIIPMYFGHGRGRFKTQDAQMYRRKMKYDGRKI